MDELSFHQDEDVLSRLCLNKVLSKYSLLQNPEVSNAPTRRSFFVVVAPVVMTTSAPAL